MAQAAESLEWSPELIEALLDELHVDDQFEELVGQPTMLPPRQYPHAVAVALMLRHSWRSDDLAWMAKRLGLLK